MLTYNNFTASFPLADFTAENWEAFVRDGVNPEQNNFDELKSGCCTMRIEEPHTSSRAISIRYLMEPLIITIVP